MNDRLPPTLPTSHASEALLYLKLDGHQVKCQLCAHRCLIDENKRGTCQVRENRAGTLYTLAYGWTLSQHKDVVEKKPLFHFYPDSSTYSLATSGCNFHCPFCINWEVSQTHTDKLEIQTTVASPLEIVAAACRLNCRSIAFTYVEPSIFFEYAHEIARLAHSAGLLNLYKTNGFMTEEMLALAGPYLDAANVDLKAFRDRTYCNFGGRLQPVLDSLKRMKNFGIWLEITTVIIPGINDDPSELEACANFIAQELGRDTPWHVTRFFPAYQMDHVPPTPPSTLHAAREIGLKAGLNYVYFGNLLESGKQDTICVSCGTVLIERRGSHLVNNHLQEGKCPHCSIPLPGVGLALTERRTA
jgi:pyruvate formate lyase activating enzyme